MKKLRFSSARQNSARQNNNNISVYEFKKHNMATEWISRLRAVPADFESLDDLDKTETLNNYLLRIKPVPDDVLQYLKNNNKLTGKHEILDLGTSIPIQQACVLREKYKGSSSTTGKFVASLMNHWCKLFEYIGFRDYQGFLRSFWSYINITARIPVTAERGTFKEYELNENNKILKLHAREILEINNKDNKLSVSGISGSIINTSSAKTQENNNTIYENGKLKVYVEESQNGKIEWKSGNKIIILIYTVGDLCGNGELIKFFAEYRSKLRAGRKSIQKYLFGEKWSLSKSIKQYLKNKNNADKSPGQEPERTLDQKAKKLESIEQKIPCKNQKQ